MLNNFPNVPQLFSLGSPRAHNFLALFRLFFLIMNKVIVWNCAHPEPSINNDLTIVNVCLTNDVFADDEEGEEDEGEGEEDEGE